MEQSTYQDLSSQALEMFANDPLVKNSRYMNSIRTIDHDMDQRGANHPDIAEHHKKMNLIERGG